MAKKSYNTKEVTKFLRELAAEAHTISVEDGAVITKGEALARLLWDKALGYVEKKMDDEGNETEIPHEPASWAIQLVYDRMEGRVPQSITEEAGGMTAAERVSEMSKRRLNDRATSVIGKSSSGPPTYKRKNSAQ